MFRFIEYIDQRQVQCRASAVWNMCRNELSIEAQAIPEEQTELTSTYFTLDVYKSGSFADFCFAYANRMLVAPDF